MSDLSHRSAAGAEAERLDQIIDDVARRMTDGAAPNDLRARVLARIETPRARWTLWALAPIAAAALIIVAAFVARDFVARPFQDRDRGPLQPTLQESAPPIAQGQAATSPESPRVAKARLASESDVDALAPPPIETLSVDVGALATESIAIPPLETIDPIPVAPLATPEGERP